MEIYFVRHANTFANINHMYQGQLDNNISMLSNEGKKQVKLLSKRFENIQFDKIYTSPLKRSYLTAKQLINKKNKNKLSIVKELIERYYGIVQGRKKTLITKTMRKLFVNLYGYSFYGIENNIQLKFRIVNFLNNMVLENDINSKIIVVSHSGVLNCIMKIIDKSYTKKINLNNTAVSLYNYENNIFERKFINDCSHLVS